MDLNIDKLDLDEKNKIATLLRERQGGEVDKGVDYIFKGPNNQEEYLLGKKIDLNNVIKDERALMGESEIEFKERMERKKMLIKMREDPMAIIQFNEQYARKIAMEKHLVHQKFMKKDEQRMQNRRRQSSTDSEDNDDVFKALKKLVQDNLSSGDEDILPNLIKTKDKPENLQNNSKSNKCSKTSDFDSDFEKKTGSRHKRPSSKEKYYSSKRNENLKSVKEVRRRSIDRHKVEHSRERERRDVRNRHRSKSEKRDTHKNKETNKCRSRSRDRYRNDDKRYQDKNKVSISKYRNEPPKAKLSAAELEKKRKEMENNSKEINMRRNQIYDMNKKTEAVEENYMKNVKMDDEFFHLKSTSIRSELSLTEAIRVKAAQNRVKKVFGR